MTDSTLAYSIQPFSITITGATGTATLSPAVGSGAFILFGGFSDNDTTGNFKYDYAGLTLTNSTTVTATRGGSNTPTTTVNGVVIDGTANLVTSVQYGTVVIASGTTSNTATITSVNTADSAVVFLGQSVGGNASGIKAANATVTLASSTSVQASIDAASGYNTTAYFCVVTFASVAIKTLQTVNLTSTTSTTTDTYTLSNSVTPSNAFVLYGGTTTASNGPASGCFYAELASASTVNFISNTAGTLTRTHNATVVELQPGYINTQRGVITIGSGSTSATATLSPTVDTTVTAVNFLGDNTSQTTTYTGYESDTTLTLTNSSTVTANVNTATNTNATSFEAISFLGFGVLESGNAQDSTSAANTTSASLAESGSGADTIGATANFAGIVIEAGSGADSISAAYHAVGAVGEAGSASDAQTAANTTHAAMAESGSGADTITARAIYSASVVESGSASDSMDGIAALGTFGVSESGNAQDTISATFFWHGHISESGNAQDSVSADLIPYQPYVNIIGSPSDIQSRLLTNLPKGWFPPVSLASPASDVAPILAALLSGPVSALVWNYSQIEYVAEQTRIATATDFNLDIISQDYFGFNLPRRAGETDGAFSARIRANLLQPHGTRACVSNAVQALTGTAPAIFEPMNTDDTGGYASLAHPHRYYGAAYNYAGGYGSRYCPAQFFVKAQGANASVNPQANLNGYSGYLSGYANPSNLVPGYHSAYVSGKVNYGSVTDDQIYKAVNENRPAGVIAWTQITN